MKTNKIKKMIIILLTAMCIPMCLFFGCTSEIAEESSKTVTAEYNSELYAFSLELAFDKTEVRTKDTMSVSASLKNLSGNDIGILFGITTGFDTVENERSMISLRLFKDGKELTDGYAIATIAHIATFKKDEVAYSKKELRLKKRGNYTAIAAVSISANEDPDPVETFQSATKERVKFQTEEISLSVK